jgi:hypothetical protein
MPAKINNIDEESAAEREVAVTRVALACALVLVILFWITSSPPLSEGRSVQFSICRSLGGGDASTQGEGECAEGIEMIRASLAMPKVFAVAGRMMGEAWADPKPFEMTATFADEDGRPLLTMQMVLVSAEARDLYAQESGSIDGGKQTMERLAEHLSARFAAKNEEE